MPIRRLFVANRGEIAVRVFRACRALGIETVAGAAPDDLGSLHARSADQVADIASYLYSEEHIRAALTTGADAVHPGYGFFAENASFAEAVDAAGLTWVGPPPEALRLGGDKLAAKRIAREAGVPVLPDGTPEEIGFPLLVKAAAGGGGRGMRLVRSPAELEDALAAAEREAAGAFGDGTLYCERYVERPRHVEVQLLADVHGNVVALGERDCSVQRRHQKVLEEAPAPGLAPALREQLYEAAVAFGRAIGYRSAGTVEFIVDGDDVFFLELNGRIQVEHPVTEGSPASIWSSGRSASRKASRSDRTVTRSRDARSRCASMPRIPDVPAASRPHRTPDAADELVRVDAGVEEGDEIGLAYDPMIAKLIAHGAAGGGARPARRRPHRERCSRRDDEPSVPPLACLTSRRARGPRHHGVPDRAPPTLGAAAPSHRCAFPRIVETQPPRTASRGAARHRRRVTAPDHCARCELGHGTDALERSFASRSKRAT